MCFPKVDSWASLPIAKRNHRIPRSRGFNANKELLPPCFAGFHGGGECEVAGAFATIDQGQGPLPLPRHLGLDKNHINFFFNQI